MAEVATMRFDAEARYAALDQRVTNMSERINAFEGTVSRNFSQLDASIAANANENRAAISALANEIRANQRTPWTTLISLGLLLLAVVGAVGGLAYAPVSNGLVRLESALGDLTTDVRGTIDGLPDKYITRTESERLSARATEEREQFRQDIRRLEDMVTVPAWTAMPGWRQ